MGKPDKAIVGAVRVFTKRHYDLERALREAGAMTPNLHQKLVELLNRTKERVVLTALQNPNAGAEDLVYAIDEARRARAFIKNLRKGPSKKPQDDPEETALLDEST